MPFWETSKEEIEKFWRAFRHSETAANCEVVPGDEDNNFHPAMRPLRVIQKGEELLINFRNVPSEILDSFPWLAAIVAEKLAKHDQAIGGHRSDSDKDFPGQKKQ